MDANAGGGLGPQPQSPPVDDGGPSPSRQRGTAKAPLRMCSAQHQWRRNRQRLPRDLPSSSFRPRYGGGVGGGLRPTGSAGSGAHVGSNRPLNAECRKNESIFRQCTDSCRKKCLFATRVPFGAVHWLNLLQTILPAKFEKLYSAYLPLGPKPTMCYLAILGVPMLKMDVILVTFAI